jgi:formylmethanofuran dehydrogenase subunit E
MNQRRRSTMKDLKEYYDVALEFHGHKCPAMPMGLRAGLAALKALGVERAKDKELIVESETGEGQAAGCFVDGLMVATGATYGKANIKKFNYGKMAFTLIDTRTGSAVRASLKPEFFEKALSSPFVQKRREGMLPQDIPLEITQPQVERVLSLKEVEFLTISDVFQRKVKKGSTNFDLKRCAKCGEAVFTDKLKEGPGGKAICIPCSEAEGGN